MNGSIVVPQGFPLIRKTKGTVSIIYCIFTCVRLLIVLYPNNASNSLHSLYKLAYYICLSDKKGIEKFCARILLKSKKY